MNWKWLAIIPSVIFTWVWQDLDSAPLGWDTTENFFGAEKIISRLRTEPLWRAPLAFLLERPFRYNSISIFLVPFWAFTQEISSATKYFSLSSLIFCNCSVLIFLSRWIKGLPLILAVLAITTLPLYFIIAQQPYAEILFLGFYLFFCILCFPEGNENLSHSRRHLFGHRSHSTSRRDGLFGIGGFHNRGRSRKAWAWIQP